MSRRQGKRELWLHAKARIERAAKQDRARVLREVIEEAGLTEAEAIRRVVEDSLGENPAEDQVRALTAFFSATFGMKPDRFIALWRERRDKR